MPHIKAIEECVKVLHKPLGFNSPLISIKGKGFCYSITQNLKHSIIIQARDLSILAYFYSQVDSHPAVRCQLQVFP